MKATQVSSTLARINIEALPADAQRSLAQRYNAWAKEYGIEAEPKVASPVKGIKFTPIPTHKEKPMPKVTLDLNDPVQRKVAEMFGLIEAEPTPIKRTTSKPKPKVNTFYEDVIVGGYEKRAEAKPHKCAAKGCYKFGHRFTDAGWFGTSTTQGHLALAARYHKGR